jgi:redox-sensitive bicupin YhaK (pirin superfamily)
MNYRKIDHVFPSVKVNMGGNVIDQPLPHRKLDMLDPFLLIHHWEDSMPGNQEQRNVGVGPHPHRGFTPVSFIFKGGIHHRDSTGHESVIYGGGTQWMNSGFGIIHSERPAKEIVEEGGDVEFIQFWVNAPANKKMEPASYQPLTDEETPKVHSSDGKITVGVVAGNFLKKKGPIHTHSPLLTLRIQAFEGGRMELPIPSHYNVIFYPLNTGFKINDDVEINAKDMVVFEQGAEGISIAAKGKGDAIILAGEPIAEPVVSYGPFVMNSQKEIMQAIQDYQMGKLGTLKEQFG